MQKYLNTGPCFSTNAGKKQKIQLYLKCFSKHLRANAILFAIFPLPVPEAADVINPMTLTCKCSTTVVLPVANICKDI